MKDLEHRVALFKAAKTRQELAESLGYQYKFFVFFIFAKDIDQHYTEYNIAKGYKKERVIAAPNEKLKRIQKNLADILLYNFNPKRCVHAFVKNKNIVTNASPHLKSRHVLRLDIKEFFPSIHFGRVRNLFEAAFNFSREISTTIARICCYRGSLPQGAPTSPIISNMVCLRMDAQLTRLAKDNFCHYTRYADDITFSTNKESFNQNIIFSINPLVLSDNIVKIVEYYNFFNINNDKTNIRSHNDSKFITGVKVNSKLNVARKKYREVRAMLHAVRAYGHDKALEEHIAKYSRRKRSTHQTNFYNIIQGKIAFLGMVRGNFEPLVSKLKIQLAHLRELNDQRINKRLIEKAQSQIRDNFALILCEGKTDRIYLSFAFSKLRSKGFFKNLNLLFYIWTAAEGCSVVKNDLLPIPCKGLLAHYSVHPKIYIFDRDISKPNDYVNVIKSHEAPKYWGENTWSFLLHEPSFRQGYGDSISIEHFFADEIIFSPDEKGRRIYCNSEFDCGTPISCTSKNPKKNFKLISDPDVSFQTTDKGLQYRLRDDEIMRNGINIARSKFSLAKQIIKSGTINGDSLEEFKKVFHTIEGIIKKSQK